MQPIAAKNTRNSSKSNQSAGRQPADTESRRWPKGTFSLISIVSGAMLGLCAPGIGIWPLAWVGLAPLLLLSVSSRGVGAAVWRGLLFGVAYNLVYANFLLGLHPLDWLGFSGMQGVLMAATAWLILCTHQGVLIAIFSGILRALPMHGSFFPEKLKGR